VPKRPTRRCIVPRCPSPIHYRGRCKTHQPPPWSRYTPDPTRPRGRAWRELALYILDRDEHRCYVCGELGADQVDHVRNIADDGARWSPSNLAAIHDDPCHRDKSREEAKRGAMRARARRAREADET